MAGVPSVIKQWQMVQPTTFNKETKEKTPGKLELAEIPVPELKEGEVLVEVAGCGVPAAGRCVVRAPCRHFPRQRPPV